MEENLPTSLIFWSFFSRVQPGVNAGGPGRFFLFGTIGIARIELRGRRTGGGADHYRLVHLHLL
jgi:hypothetical protein